MPSTPEQAQRSLPADGHEVMRVSDAIIAISADAIISIDDSQRITRFNHGAEEIFGYTAEEMIGRRIELLIPERFRSAHEHHVRAFVESPVAARRMGERRQISALRSTGEEFPAEASISKTRVGGHWLLTVVLRDVTVRARAEQRQRFLAEAGALLAGSLDPESTLEKVARLTVPALGEWCVVFLGSEGKVRRTYAVHADAARAPQMRRLGEIPFEMKPDHPVVRCLTLGETVRVAIEEDMLASMADDQEHYHLLRSLEPRSLLAVPLRARDRVIGALSLFFSSGGRAHQEEDVQLAEDLASRAGLALDNARLYQDAQVAIRARDDVLAIVSHDLGNPLAAIRVGTSVLLRQLDPAALRAAQPTVENIRASVQQMERLILDLLDIKRIEAGILSLRLERLALSDVLTSAEELWATLASSRTLRFRCSAPAHRHYVMADRDRVLQVFSNLIGNAAKFTPQGGEIEIGAQPQESSVEFWVRDNGPGIPAEQIPHIFNRFWQADRTGRQSIGLGLAIVKGIVDAHGGLLRVVSATGGGSTFYFTLPTAP